MTNLTGFVNIIKPTGMGSTDVVSKVKRILGTKKVGHLGTLDSPATGVLPIAIGKATKFFDYFLSKDKEYFALVEFGIKTDTLDSFGEIVGKREDNITAEMINGVLPKFIGEISQIPPKYSAIKINGKRASDLARENIDFEIKPRKITIFDVRLMQNPGQNNFIFKVHCSAGTYIRTLFSDIAESLGTISTTPVIIRTKSGLFTTKNAITLEELEKNKQILSISDIFCDFLKIEANEYLSKKLINGVKINANDFLANAQIYENTFNNLKQTKKEFFITTNNEYIGMYKANNNYIENLIYLFENR